MKMSHSRTVNFILFPFNFEEKLSFITRVSTGYHKLVKTLDKCQRQISKIIFDSPNLLQSMW